MEVGGDMGHGMDMLWGPGGRWRAMTTAPSPDPGRQVVLNVRARPALFLVVPGVGL